MRRPLIVAIVLLALVAAALLVVRSALDADVIRPAAEARLSAMLGQPVSIGSMHVSVLPVPALVGSEIRVGPERDAPELTLQRIRIVPRIGSLFRGPYVIREVTLEGLTARVVREPPGRWRFPTVIPAPGADHARQVVIERVRLTGGRVRVFQFTSRDGMRETSSIDDVEGEAVAEGAGLRISPIRGRIGQAPIAGEAVLDAQAARIDFTLGRIEQGDLPAVLGLSGADPPESFALTKPAAASMSIRVDRQTLRLTGTGSLRAPEVSVESVRLHGVEAPVRTDGVLLVFEPTTFAMYGGAYRGTVTIDLSKPPARWLLDGRMTGVDVSGFLRDFTGRDRLAGTASATTALRGTVGEPIPRGLEGRLQLDVSNGVIHGFPLLAAINSAMRLAEGDSRDTRFDRLTATFAFAGAHATTNDLLLNARDVRVEAAGRIGFDRSLDLAGEAILSPERTAGAIRTVRELSGLRNDRGELELPLTIRGTLDNPSFNIDLKTAVGRSLKEELRRRLRDLIRRPPG
jgi:uncharacterized protein involved in outer membrane biogenesis